MLNCLELLIYLQVNHEDSQSNSILYRKDLGDHEPNSILEEVEKYKRIEEEGKERESEKETDTLNIMETRKSTDNFLFIYLFLYLTSMSEATLLTVLTSFGTDSLHSFCSFWTETSIGRWFAKNFLGFLCFSKNVRIAYNIKIKFFGLSLKKLFQPVILVTF